MTEIERLKHLKLVLRIVGLFGIFGFYPITVVWPSGWAWSSACSRISGILSERCVLWLVPTWNLPTQCQSLQAAVRP
jgi:hypothetical protein